MPPSGDLVHDSGMRPDGELNQWPFGSQASTRSTEPHQPGLFLKIKKKESMEMRPQKGGEVWGDSESGA